MKEVVEPTDVEDSAVLSGSSAIGKIVSDLPVIRPVFLDSDEDTVPGISLIHLATGMALEGFR